MNKRELEFRKDLAAGMAPFWSLTIHVENHLNPGVPDLSYVMHDPKCETGWLELKAIEYQSSNRHWPGIKIEPGQHRWMRTHAKRVPGHFLVLFNNLMFLVPGHEHDRLCACMSVQQLEYLARGVMFDRKDHQRLAAALSIVSNRDFDHGV